MKKKDLPVDPLKRIRKLSMEVSAIYAVLTRRSTRLILTSGALLNLFLYVAGVDVWKGVKILLFCLTGAWAFDIAFVLSSAVTGVFSVEDVPPFKRARVLLRAIARHYVHPQSTWDSTQAALQEAREAHLGVRAIRRAEGFPDRIYHEVQKLVAAGKAEEALSYIRTKEIEAQQHFEAAVELRRKARIAHCEPLTRQSIKIGDFAEAEHIIWRANIALVEAAKLGIREEIIAFIESNRLGEAEQWISRTRRDQERERTYAVLKERVDAVPIEKHGYLQRLLEELKEFEFESRDYRKARYLLEKEIEKTKRPPE